MREVNKYMLYNPKNNKIKGYTSSKAGAKCERERGSPCTKYRR
jgi:hypothetical protein